MPLFSNGFVPYVGASADVDIGAHSFRATSPYIYRTVTAEATAFDFRDSSAASTTYGYTAFGWWAGSSSTSIDLEHTNSSTAAGASVDHTTFMDDQTHYGGFGQASKNYNVAGSSAIGGYDQYLYSILDNIALIAYGSGKKVSIAAGGGNTANVIADFNASGMHNRIANQTGYTTTATAAGTTTLTNASTQQQLFTGTSTQTVKLPDTSTLTVGDYYDIKDLSTGVVTIQTSTATDLTKIPQGIEVRCRCISTANNNASSWDVTYSNPQKGAFTVASTTASTPQTTPTVGSISNLSAAPSATTGSGPVVTVTNSTSKIEITVTCAGFINIWMLGNNNGASTSPNFDLQFYLNGAAIGKPVNGLWSNGWQVPIQASGATNVVAGNLIELKWAQTNGTGARSTTFQNMNFNWIWTPA